MTKREVSHRLRFEMSSGFLIRKGTFAAVVVAGCLGASFTLAAGDWWRSDGGAIEFSQPKGDTLLTNLNELSAPESGLQEDFLTPHPVGSHGASGSLLPLPAPQTAVAPRRSSKGDANGGNAGLTPQDIINNYVLNQFANTPESVPTGNDDGSVAPLERLYDIITNRRGSMTPVAPGSSMGSPTSGGSSSDSQSVPGVDPAAGGLGQSGFGSDLIPRDSWASPLFKSSSLSDVFGLARSSEVTAPTASSQMTSQSSDLDQLRKMLAIQPSSAPATALRPVTAPVSPGLPAPLNPSVIGSPSPVLGSVTPSLGLNGGNGLQSSRSPFAAGQSESDASAASSTPVRTAPTFLAPQRPF